MKRLIYQVCLGKAKKSKLYARCIESVREYCERHGIEHKVQTQPILRIAPDVFATNRSKESYEKHGGFLPIYEKENAFNLLHDYDQIAIIDADIFIRETAPNIFDEMEDDVALGAVYESQMPINGAYRQKILNYSQMQYSQIAPKIEGWKPNHRTGFPFMNMGMMVMNSENMLKALKGATAQEFLLQPRFKDFIDGKGAWKWSTDQTLLNWWLRKDKVPVQGMDWKWNGLFTALEPGKIEQAHFVHFFLKDKLPEAGENINELMDLI